MDQQRLDSAKAILANAQSTQGEVFTATVKIMVAMHCIYISACAHMQRTKLSQPNDLATIGLEENLTTLLFESVIRGVGDLSGMTDKKKFEALNLALTLVEKSSVPKKGV